MWYNIWNRSAQHWLKKTFTAPGYNFLRVISLQPSTNQMLKSLSPSLLQHFVIFCQYWTAEEGYGASSKQLILSVKGNEVLTDCPSSDLPDYHLEYQNDKTEMKYDKIKMFLLLMQLRNITTTKCRLCLASAVFNQWKDLIKNIIWFYWKTSKQTEKCSSYSSCTIMGPSRLEASSLMMLISSKVLLMGLSGFGHFGHWKCLTSST